MVAAAAKQFVLWYFCVVIHEKIKIKRRVKFHLNKLSFLIPTNRSSDCLGTIS